ncbi:hypothetical protein F5884DRAFT_68646 [Xylogone sp. PMI_703]|nr:hypothetical protein F5884DRAFT_68646 [Xylogone sp. PMI_703]
MAESENFEEDLFADLYTEDDNAAKPTSAISETKTAPSVPAEVPVEETVVHHDQNGDHEDQEYHGEQDVDDEIDFNLGNSNSNADDIAATNESHGTGIKEDG